MRRLILFVTAGALVAFAVIAPAAAKGPSTASLTGPGSRPCTTDQGRRRGGARHAARIARPARRVLPADVPRGPGLDHSDATCSAISACATAWCIACQGPNGISTVVQDVYPYAKTPVTYMRPNQHFWGGHRTHGGWFVAGPGLKATLVGPGCPSRHRGVRRIVSVGLGGRAASLP